MNVLVVAAVTSALLAFGGCATRGPTQETAGPSPETLHIVKNMKDCIAQSPEKDWEYLCRALYGIEFLASKNLPVPQEALAECKTNKCMWIMVKQALESERRLTDQRLESIRRERESLRGLGTVVVPHIPYQPPRTCTTYPSVAGYTTTRCY